MNYVNPHPPGCYWYDAAEKFGAPNIKWCEETLCHVITEPANTWSNLAYIIIAIIMFFITRKMKSKSLRFAPYAMFLMGAGSFYFHMSNFYVSQVIDFVGMFIFVHWLVAINLIRAKKFNLKKVSLLYIGFMLVNCLVMHLLYLNTTNFQFLIVIAVVLVLYSEYLARKNGSLPSTSKFLKAGFVGVLIAETFSLLDMSRIMCNPENHVIQGHAIWHLISSIALFLAFLYFTQFDESLSNNEDL